HDYIERAMQSAASENAELIVIMMDTPGGLDSAMRAIIKNITSATIPVATYVAPTGSRAASAGTYILYASHIAAMAPGTNLGAATPVQIGGISPPQVDDQDESNGDEAKTKTEKEDASKNKAINDAAAYIRGLAKLRGRNEQWAEKAVLEAASLSATEALENNVIDFIATDLEDLLAQLHGHVIEIQGVDRTLQTKGATISVIGPDWRSELLSVITNPNVAYILLLVGIYGLIFEFSNPGALVPGTVGAICLLLALYSLQLLPINYAGMALLLLGIALMIGEAFQPSFGMLGIGGVIAFVIGSIILMDTEAPGFGIDLSIIFTFALTSIVMFVFVVGMALKSRRRPVVSGAEQLLGSEGVVIDDFENNGEVFVHSEAWSAQSDKPLSKGQRVRVTGMNGLTLDVEPMESSGEEEVS
ncbi:MAG: nodulation protein NfeD, partial [Gammaproteobacteria bacterium]|nr:nodulation protein NfeD [Gammaproteobacteria bacterium]